MRRSSSMRATPSRVSPAITSRGCDRRCAGKGEGDASRPGDRRRRLHRLAPRRAAARATATACACSTTSRPATAKNLDFAPQGAAEGAARSSKATSATGRRSRGRWRGVEVVFHQAALASVARSIAEPALVDEVNVGGTLNAPRGGARRRGAAGGVRRLLLGVRRTPPICPSTRSSGRCRSPPTRVTKLAGEEYLRVFHARVRPRDRHPALLQRLRPAPGPPTRSTRR